MGPKYGLKMKGEDTRNVLWTNLLSLQRLAMRLAPCEISPSGTQRKERLFEL